MGFAGIRDIVAERSAAYEQELRQAKQIAVEENVIRLRESKKGTLLRLPARTRLMYSIPSRSSSSSRESVPSSNHDPSSRCMASSSVGSPSPGRSPTRASSKSVKVISPSISPYSWTTRAIDLPVCLKRLRRVKALVLSGTKSAGWMMARRFRGCPLTSCVYRKSLLFLLDLLHALADTPCTHH